MRTKTKTWELGPLSLTLGLHPWDSWLGFGFAAVLPIACLVLNYSMAAAFGTALLFCLAAVIKLDCKKRAGKWTLNALWVIGVFVSLCVIAPAMVNCPSFLEIGLRKVLMNILFCAIVCAVVLLVLGNWRWAVTGGAFLLLVLAVVNGYVFIFRERELTLLDIFTTTTAMKVAGQYDHTPSPPILFGVWAGFLALYSQVCLPDVPKGKGLWVRLGSAVFAAAAVALLYFATLNLSPLRWNNDGSGQNGTYLNVYLGIRESRVKAPKGYAPQQIEELAGEYPQTSGTAGPNIIVIMNEAYCDLDVYPNKAATNIPVTPCWDSLQENTVRGYALASVYGGNTVNSEFEFLTGSTMAFLPMGAVPYGQYVQENSFSLAWALRSYGYQTIATHNYDASGWSREDVYPRLGFRICTFLDSYPQKDLIRDFVSDREQYEYILDLMDSQQEPTFLFAVTMQNHGGYIAEPGTYDHTVTLTDAPGEYPAVEQYLSLLHASDQAMAYLFERLENTQEKTVVLIYGDHQPKLDTAFYRRLNGGALDTLPEQMTQHTVPFVIWANYDIEEKDLGLTSLNYLSVHLLEAAGLEPTAFHQYLAELEQTIPAMNMLGYYSKEQGSFVSFSHAQGAEAEAILTYKKVQYNALFDRSHSSEAFFRQYLPE